MIGESAGKTLLLLGRNIHQKDFRYRQNSGQTEAALGYSRRSLIGKNYKQIT